ncbi:two-component system, OmpR family, response regulator BaeR [Desulfacinum infernum DSM 9756]|jgi:two-component system response regulator BaeR|uniref:Phosphate regulon transcriptional regulatory protein PhoB n=1 Tax=Desulfacinum infernum DSM 9756 TaxID=1121391 RepID=A0A1M4ZE97_9BACT|nr:response regulator [Desulfacinum infernum]MBC7358392.1 response regulator [Desulfacinum sp.]MBZ4659144.1 response regulator with CheY-like receiver domain and winged-helix DNA-binding domain [Desulfacinum sp.]SHF16340.1 two-component system, OmpR family, response regulator BaeR [Desulfacinum infernum DSM 9756]
MADRITVLVVEDEAKIAGILKDYLEKSGYRAVVVDRGDAALDHVRRNPPGLILLDIMLPGLDGMSVCREIRSFSSVPIIMITARVEELDRLLGLELGADDYICKPFSPREVVARVRAVLRRSVASSAVETGTIFRVGHITLNPETRQVVVHGREVRLTPSEFGLLKTLMSRPNRVFSRAELIGAVQGYDFDGYDRTIDSHVKNLRKKLARHLPDCEVISTIYGVGYRLNAAVEK